MSRLPRDLPERLEATGWPVRVVPGWELRGAGLLVAELVLVHDDIIAGCPRTVPSAIVNGVQQPTQYVPGPLYNGWTGCDGTLWVVASGVANNAGRGSYAGYTGNRRTVAWCRSFHPDRPPSPGQLEVVNAATAAAAGVLAGAIGVGHDRIIRHEDWTTRKKDTWFWSTAAIRTAAAQEADDMTPEQAEQLASIHRMISGDRPLPFGLRSTLAAAQHGAVYVVIDADGGRWVTDLVTVRRRFPGGHPFLAMAEGTFGAPKVELDRGDTALFLRHVPEGPTVPTAA